MASPLRRLMADRGRVAGRVVGDDPPGRAARWSAAALDAGWAAAIASWPIRDTLDGVLFCHGSPRRVDEVLTRATPDDVLRDALAGAGGSLVVGGHTHQQFRRGGYVNAGSVGRPYEGRPGAFWLVLEDGVPGCARRATTWRPRQPSCGRPATRTSRSCCPSRCWSR